MAHGGLEAAHGPVRNRQADKLPLSAVLILVDDIDDAGVLGLQLRDLIDLPLDESRVEVNVFGC